MFFLRAFILLAFGLFPVVPEFLGILEMLVSKHMRVTANHFGGDVLERFGQCEGFFPFIECGYEDEDENDVAEFFHGFGPVAGADSLDEFKGFLGEIVAHGQRRLFPIPGAAVRGYEGIDDVKKLLQGRSLRVLFISLMANSSDGE